VGLKRGTPTEGRPASSDAAPTTNGDWPAPNHAPESVTPEELEAIRKAVDDAASVGGALWLSYLFVLFYLAVATGAVTHTDLFFENPVKLPFLNIELPLLAFFTLAPVLFIIMHAYALVHLVMLTEKAKRFHHKNNGKDERAESLRWQLPSNIFIQFLAGPKDIRGGRFGMSLRAIAWITLVIAPILLLLMMQIQFLPFHSSFITWTHRVILFADLLLLWWLWRKILSDEVHSDGHQPSRPWTVVGLALSFCVALFSWAVVTFPGEWQTEHLVAWRIFPTSDDAGRPITVPFHDWVFNSKVDPVARRRWLAFSSTLVLTGFNVLEGLGIDDPDKAKWREFIFRARGRDLKGASFAFASLPRVDFTGAELQGASFYKAQLDRVSLDKAQLQGASLYGAVLHDAFLVDAHLEHSMLNEVELQGALLDRANLEGASLDRAHLEGASFDLAQLRGASFDHAHLEGATLNGAQLQASNFNSAYLEGGMLDGAQLQGADLTNVGLQGGSLQYAQLQGASLQLASLQATDLSGALLWRTNHRAPPEVPRPAAVKLSDAADQWSPVWGDQGDGTIHPWNDDAYGNLRRMIEFLPYQGLPRIRNLDCALASCDPTQPPPPEAAAWRNLLEAARVDDSAFVKALAAELKPLVCSGGDDAIYVLRGLLRRSQSNRPLFGPVKTPFRLQAVGPEAPALIDFILGKDCPVSASLTDADRATLLQIKRQTAPD
jgi:uncharacterized protein YjbI with pentapeptide repeats